MTAQTPADIDAEIEAWVDRTLPLFEGFEISDNFKESLRRSARRVAEGR
jgi:hypothetical protein